MSDRESRRVLLVEDNEVDAEAVLRMLGNQANRFETDHAVSLHKGLACLKAGRFDVVLLGLPDSNGLEGLTKLQESADSVPIVVLTGLDDQERALKAVQAGAYDYLVKGIISEQGLVRVIEYTIERRKIQRELEDLNATLEKRVEMRTQALEDTNRELETFAHSVSHDLQGPLRAIAGFSQILLEDHAADLNDDGRKYLSRVCANTTRMKALVTDMLTYARQTRGELTYEEVDLSQLAHKISKELREQEPHRQVVLDIADGLFAVGDHRMLKVMLSNLMGNAWKYTKDRSPAHIAFQEADQTDTSVFFVRDNGAGFDPKFAQTIFDPFKRLHSGEEFSGTGIGLSTVQRIVRRHGGWVWAEAKEGAGATFYFTLNLDA